MLSEISQTERDKFCRISLTCGMKKKKRTQKNRKWSSGHHGLGGRGMVEMWFKGTNVQAVDK